MSDNKDNHKKDLGFFLEFLCKILVIICTCELIVALIYFIPINTVQKSCISLETYDIHKLTSLPVGFSDYQGVIYFAEDNNLIRNVKESTEITTVEDLSEMLMNLYNYRRMPDGFNINTCPEDAVNQLILEKNIDYTTPLGFCLDKGYITVDQYNNPKKELTINDITRITYRIGLNGLPELNLSGDEKAEIISGIDGLEADPPECRINKVSFLYANSLLPTDNDNLLDLKKPLTQLDALCILIDLSDVIYANWEGSSSFSRGCQPCVQNDIEKERVDYIEEKRD